MWSGLEGSDLEAKLKWHTRLKWFSRVNDTNSWVEPTLENHLAWVGCPRVYIHMIKLKHVFISPFSRVGSTHEFLTFSIKVN